MLIIIFYNRALGIILVRYFYYLYLWTEGNLDFLLGMGNCGWSNSAGDPVVAISKELYDANAGSNCGQVNFYLPSYYYFRWSFLYSGW